MESKIEHAETIIRNHVVFAAGGGLIPIPLMDIAAVTAIQIDMLQQLSSLYDISYSRSAGKLRISALAGGTLARVGASLIKAIPGVGSLIGSVSMSLLSGASTYALGKVFLHHYETGGTLYDFDPESYRDEYESHMEEGKAKAKEWKEEDAARNQEDPQQEKLAKLKELGQLKADGVITDKEFKAMKKKILDEF